MDNVKLILVLIVLLLEVVACSKKGEQPAEAAECTAYASPYQVEFPDNSLRKSSIEACGSIYKATDLGQGNSTIESAALTIELRDAKTGIPYLTTFDGQ